MEDIIDLYIGKDNIRTVIEAGACDCADSVAMSVEYPNAHIYAFECNPETLPLCRTMAESNPRISLIEKAVSDKDGDITFFPIDTKLTKTTHANGNPGASSMFKASGLYPLEEYVQKEITVPCTTLKTFCDDYGLNTIDLLWLDAQGAELSILKGLGRMLEQVKIIKTEVLFKEQYTGAPLEDEIVDFLEKKGFRFVRYLEKWEWFGDAVFISKKL